MNAWNECRDAAEAELLEMLHRLCPVYDDARGLPRLIAQRAKELGVVIEHYVLSVSCDVVWGVATRGFSASRTPDLAFWPREMYANVIEPELCTIHAILPQEGLPVSRIDAVTFSPRRKSKVHLRMPVVRKGEAIAISGEWSDRLRSYKSHDDGRVTYEKGTPYKLCFDFVGLACTFDDGTRSPSHV